MRLFDAAGGITTAAELQTIAAADIRASRVFAATDAASPN
jgi:hypothetical protein